MSIRLGLALGIAMAGMIAAADTVAQSQDSSAAAMQQLNAMGYRVTERGLVNRNGQVVDPASVGSRGGDVAFVQPSASERVPPGGNSQTFEYGDAAAANSGAVINPQVTTVSGGGRTGSANAAASGGRRAPIIGPSVEMITGGGSADGAARVGRLPILD